MPAVIDHQILIVLLLTLLVGLFIVYYSFQVSFVRPEVSLSMPSLCSLTVSPVIAGALLAVASYLLILADN